MRFCMEKEYIDVNRKTYDKLAKEYSERNYAVNDDFYLNIMFKGLDFSEGKKILEIGPGRGDRLKNFSDFNMDVYAIELSSEMYKICSSKVPQAKIINKNVFECSFDFKFDFIYMEAMIHNFPLEDAKKLLKLVSSWLKEDGVLICTTTVEKSDYEGYEEKSDYQNKEKRFRHRYTESSFEEIFKNEFTIIDKKYKKEEDETRNKLWQIIYAKKL